MNFHAGNVGDHLALLKVWLVCNQQLEFIFSPCCLSCSLLIFDQGLNPHFKYASTIPQVGAYPTYLHISFFFVSGAISIQVYDQWKETNFSTQWCYENYIQVWALQSTYVSLSQIALSLLYPSFLP
jgi:hypothetical protein